MEIEGLAEDESALGGAKFDLAPMLEACDAATGSLRRERRGFQPEVGAGDPTKQPSIFKFWAGSTWFNQSFDHVTLPSSLESLSFGERFKQGLEIGAATGSSQGRRNPY